MKRGRWKTARMWMLNFPNVCSCWWYSPSTIGGSLQIQLIHLQYLSTEAEAPILWPLDAKSQFTGKDPDAGENWGQKEEGKSEDEMVSVEKEHDWCTHACTSVSCKATFFLVVQGLPWQPSWWTGDQITRAKVHEDWVYIYGRKHCHTFFKYKMIVAWFIHLILSLKCPTMTQAWY